MMVMVVVYGILRPFLWNGSYQSNVKMQMNSSDRNLGFHRLRQTDCSRMPKWARLTYEGKYSDEVNIVAYTQRDIDFDNNWSIFGLPRKTLTWIMGGEVSITHWTACVNVCWVFLTFSQLDVAGTRSNMDNYRSTDLSCASTAQIRRYSDVNTTTNTPDYHWYSCSIQALHESE